MNDKEQEWIQHTIQGDPEAFACLVEIYQTPVFNLCSRMLGNPQEAEDAAQETFWRVYQNINRYDPGRSFATWLLSIAAHYCIDQQRKRRLPTFDIDLLPEGNVPDNAPNPERSLFQKEQDDQLHRTLKTLNPQDRAAIIMRYWHEFSDQEIGEALDLSVSAVKSRLFRARKQIAHMWQQMMPEQTLAGEQEYESPAI